MSRTYTARVNLITRDIELLNKIDAGDSVTYHSAQRLIMLGLVYQKGLKYHLTFVGEQIIND